MFFPEVLPTHQNKMKISNEKSNNPKGINVKKENHLNKGITLDIHSSLPEMSSEVAQAIAANVPSTLKAVEEMGKISSETISEVIKSDDVETTLNYELRKQTNEYLNEQLNKPDATEEYRKFLVEKMFTNLQEADANAAEKRKHHLKLTQLQTILTIIPIVGLLVAILWFKNKYILTEEKVAEISEQVKKLHEA